MARFYTDEQFPFPVVRCLRELGHDVLTVQDAGNAGKGIPNDEVLAFAVAQQRTVLTLNRYDFVRLHRLSSNHYGIVVCTNDRNWRAFAERIDAVVKKCESLTEQLVRVTLPAS